MLQQQVYIINTILMVLDAVCVIVAGYSAFYIKYHLSFGTWTMETNVFTGSVLLIMFLNNYMMGKFQLYSDIRPPSYLNLLWSLFKVLTIDFAVLSVGIVLFRQITFSRLFMLAFAGLCFVLIAAYRILVQLYLDKISPKSFNIRKILVVGDKKRGKFVTELLNSQLSWGHEVIGTLALENVENNTKETNGSTNDFANVLRTHTIDEVVFTLDGDRNVSLSPYLDTCKKIGIPARILPALWQPDDKALSIEKCQAVPFLTIRVSNFNATGLLYKRVLDLVGGLVGSIVVFIVYPFVAAAIKLDSEGPVLFKQKRMGSHGRIFNLYKFRTMFQQAEKRRRELMEQNLMNGAMFKMENDPRITKVGKWLRKTSLDEFPQFFNVLRGEMSLVGTRPPMIEEVEEYQPQHLKRISAKPGITGLWQVSGRNKITDFDKVVELDCNYLDHWRFADDIKILFKTVLVVLQRKGAI
ncbi:MAG: sugar transferase [Deltaproteobacteria bacterium]|nr:sugar transferase [Deltaproteobacteria bacterium]